MTNETMNTLALGYAQTLVAYYEVKRMDCCDKDQAQRNALNALNAAHAALEAAALEVSENV